MEIESVTCDLCGGSKGDVVYRTKDRHHGFAGEFALRLCDSCRLLYLSPRPRPEDLSRYYPEDYTPFLSKNKTIRLFNKIVSEFKANKIDKYLNPESNIVEIGSATGVLLAALRERGHEVSGIELSGYACDMARRLYGLDIHQGMPQDVGLPQGEYDAIVMHHVVEHFPSPKKTLNCLAGMLKEGGRLFIATPNVDSLDAAVFGPYWHGLDSPRHQVVFSVDTLSKMLNGQGFEVESIAYGIVPNDWITSSRLFFKERFLGERIAKLLSIYNPFLILCFLPFSYLSHLMKKSGRIYCVARKTCS